ncbi:MAG TPA: PrpF domain-containing protein [Dermatophilaceae bacterium]|nr:PrpF domain-containing protein [Dermatophilaceae bacterium]
MTAQTTRATDDPVVSGIRCALMRGGTSKGAFFLAGDLPTDPAERNELLLRVMGSPDPRQIDGVGGAVSVTSKVAVISPSADDEADIDYLFLQVAVDEPQVSATQTCGNILAGVGPFAIERGLVAATGDTTRVRVRLVNTGAIATETVRTPGGRVTYAGTASVSGVPGTAAPVEIETDSGDAPLFPTGNRVDTVAGIEVTCVDNGMPVVVLRAADLGVAGDEDPETLEADAQLTETIRRVREEAGRLMGVPTGPDSTTPKIALVSPARAGGSASTRCFIPLRVHTSLGVLAGASIVAALALPDTVVHDLATPPADGEPWRLEHPTGHLDLGARIRPGREVGDPPSVATSVIRTARMLFDGRVFPRAKETT